MTLPGLAPIYAILKANYFNLPYIRLHISIIFKRRNSYMNTQYIYMTFIAPAFILLPILIAIFKYRSLPLAARGLFYYLITEALIILASSTLAYYHQPNTPLYHFGTMVETVLLLYFFYTVFKSTAVSAFIRWMMFLFPIFSIANTLFVQHIFEFNSYAISLQFILIIAMCFLYWWHHSNDDEKSWGVFPLNWIISGLLLYFSSSFVLFTFSNMIISGMSKNTSIVIWNIHATLSIVMYVMIGIGIYKYKR